MCCFAATDAREACRQQLRHVDDWSPVDQDTNRRLTCSVLVTPAGSVTVH